MSKRLAISVSVLVVLLSIVTIVVSNYYYSQAWDWYTTLKEYGSGPSLAFALLTGTQGLITIGGLYAIVISVKSIRKRL